MVNVIGISGSPRIRGNTTLLIKKALESAENAGANTKFIPLGKLDISPCKACNKCKETGFCSIKDDMDDVLKTISEAQGLILGSPVYFGNVTAQMKIFMDRSRPLRIDFSLRNVVSGAVSVGASRNGGQETTCAAIHDYLLIQDAIIVGDGAPAAHYGATGVGGSVNDCKNDDVGLETAKNLGKRITDLAIKLNK